MVRSVGFYSYRSCSFNAENAKYQDISLDSIYHITCNKGIPSRSTFQNENVKVQRSYQFYILKKSLWVWEFCSVVEHFTKCPGLASLNHKKWRRYFYIMSLVNIVMGQEIPKSLS